MVGRLRTSFRSGNLAEHLGILLLKGIAAVAEVPRTEDVGLDAVASLLRRDEDGNCYAEDSFVVQLKSFSETSIEYVGHGLTWFLGQTLPMFIGRVSLADSSIALYPTLHVNQAVFMLHSKSVTVRFETAKHENSWNGDGGDFATVWLGDPLVTWTVADLSNNASSILNVYGVMKRFLEFARREYGLLSFGQCSVLKWSTNDKDSIRSSFTMAQGSPHGLDALAEKARPALHALMLHASVMKEETGNAIMIPIISLVSGLRNAGVDIDPKDYFATQLIAALHLREMSGNE